MLEPAWGQRHLFSKRGELQMEEELCFMPRHHEPGEENKETTASFMRCCTSSLPAVLPPFSGLQQHKFIILFFCRLEVWPGSYWVTIKVWAELRFYLEASFPAFKGRPHPLAHASLRPPSQSSTVGQVHFPGHHPNLLFHLPLPLSGLLWLHQALWDNPG